MVRGVAHSHRSVKIFGRVVLAVGKSIIACLPHLAALMHSVEYQFIMLAFKKASKREMLWVPWRFRRLGPSVFASCNSNAEEALHRTEPIVNTRLQPIIQALFLVQ